MKILFSQGAEEVFAEIPPRAQRRAGECLEWIAEFPEISPLRLHGLMERAPAVR